MSFKPVDSTMNLPKVEEEILDFWDQNKIFEKTLEKTKDQKPYHFYDGPPFATGTPHYGHIVQSISKDVVPRYWTMRGRYVERKWGWDCHGLPIENIAEKELGIAQKKDIEKLGVDKFNETCRSMVLSYVSEWEKVIRRLGRWADMKNAYKTMDLSYMESVWWVFKELYNKGLIYEGYRSMHICPRCETTLSQSEVTEGYKMIKDLSAIAKFELVAEPRTYVLAWTTTPWTLIGNVALAIGRNIDYVKIKIEGEQSADSKAEYYILAKSRVKEVLKDQKYKIIAKMKGHDLEGLKYKSLFDYYQNIPNAENGWEIYAGDFVTTQEGTGIVHIAPAFGEDDMNLGKEFNLPFVQHIGMDGIIKPEAKDFAGLSVKPSDDHMSTDIEIIKNLAHRGLLFSKEKYEHSYPHCWRCDTPLLNYATSSWFVGVTQIKDEALALAKEINWSPKHIKEGRFGKWLEGARDWSISRQRYWASCMPIWKCDCGEKRVIGSIEELRELSGEPITKIILVRHGESEKNVNKILTATRDKWPLTEKGRAGVKKVADKINSEIDFIVSSPVLRARQTADILNEKFKLDIIEDELVSEIEFGEWTDLTKEERKKLDSYREYQEIKDDPKKRFHFEHGKTGESREDVIERTEKFIQKIVKDHKGKTILVVAHGGLYPSISKVLEDISHEEFFRRLSASSHDEVFEIYLRSNGTPFDLHKDKLDKIVIPCDCGGEMHRIPDVLDTWFDSGSMPYAQLHYPFENKDKFADGFPADFIGEAQDQCRAWFYYLHVLATGVKSSIAFKNVLVSGMVLAEDGKKMSKKLKNYPDPTYMFDKYGADPLRLYLLTSPILQAENLNFSEKEVAELYRGMFRMLWNSYSFFVLYADIDKWGQDQQSVVSNKQSENLLDRWIVSELNKLIEEVNKNMESYDLTKSARLFAPFVDNLSNWYIRRSRKRFWKSENDGDKNDAYQTLWAVLVELSKLLAPFTPFIADTIYRNLTAGFLDSGSESGMTMYRESVHLEDYPITDKKLIDDDLNTKMQQVRKIVEMGLSSRAQIKIKVRQPLNSLIYHGTELNQELESIIAEEVNVKNVRYSDGDYNIVELDIVITEELMIEGLAREIIRNIQSLRKESGFSVADRINIFYKTDSSELEKAVGLKIVAKEVLANKISKIEGSGSSFEGQSESNIDGKKILIGINR